ncbi:hypothetical protein BJY00DRAFT_324190 [Aspergillus carlsbadensis]|nr:hypothetical protein BJY00DRAFT_324190 [Aspergillus carlsbadensis]
MDIPGSFSLPTPPASPRKRRMLLRESEETEGQMSIEDYLLRSDPYRTTTTNLAWPYPLTCTPADPSIVGRVNGCKNEILRVLEEDGLPTEGYYLHFRVENVSKPEYPLGDRPQTTLRLVYLHVSVVPRRLGPIKDGVARILLQKGIVGVDVELVFLDKCFRPSLFSILSGDPAVRVYSAAGEDILALVKSKLGREWSILSLFRMGLNKAKSTPTIVIFVNPFASHDWADLALQIKLCLPHDDPEALKLEVEFIPGRLTGYTPNDASNAPSEGGKSFALTMRPDGVPTAGASITVLPERGGGSLGPFVTLDLAGKRYRGALTCCHVVRPPYVASAETLETANRYGSSPFSPHPTECDVSFYAPKDAEATVRELRGLISESKEELKSAEEEKQAREIALARVPQGVHATIQKYTEDIQQLEAKLEIVLKMPLKLGRTLVSSGQTLADNRVSDWAFIELEPKAFGKSALYPHNTYPHIPMRYVPFNPADDRTKPQPLKEGEILENFGPLTKDEWYCKTGRTTGLTSGICNGISTYCNWPAASRDRFSKDGKHRVRIEDGVTEEWVLIAEKVGSDGKTQERFCEPGDSGAGIINRRGFVCGLLYGGAEGLCGSSTGLTSGLCASIYDIKRWIEEKVPGSTLGLPQ